MLTRSRLRIPGQRSLQAKRAIPHFLKRTEGAITSSFMLLLSTALTVTTATVLTVGSGAEEAGIKVSDILVQIDPSQALDLDQPPYTHPAAPDANENTSPTVIQTEAIPPEGSTGAEGYNPSALLEGEEIASSGGGGSGGGSGGSGSGGGGFAGLLFTGTGGLDTDPDENAENSALGHSS